MSVLPGEIPHLFMWENNKYASHYKPYHVFVVEVEGIKCLPHTDTVMGSSYTSLNLTNKFKMDPIQKAHKRIETLLHSVVKKSRHL